MLLTSSSLARPDSFQTRCQPALWSIFARVVHMGCPGSRPVCSTHVGAPRRKRTPSFWPEIPASAILFMALKDDMGGDRNRRRSGRTNSGSCAEIGELAGSPIPSVVPTMEIEPWLRYSGFAAARCDGKRGHLAHWLTLDESLQGE